MARGVAMISDICRQPGESSGFGARNRHAHANTFWPNAGFTIHGRPRQLASIFETFHDGWDYKVRLAPTLEHFPARARKLD